MGSPARTQGQRARADSWQHHRRVRGFALTTPRRAPLAQSGASVGNCSETPRPPDREAVPGSGKAGRDLIVGSNGWRHTIRTVFVDINEISGVPSATPRSLAAYRGTVLPHHRLDEGERPCSGEGLPWSAVGRFRPWPVAARPSPEQRASARQGCGLRGRCAVARRGSERACSRGLPTGRGGLWSWLRKRPGC